MCGAHATAFSFQTFYANTKMGESVGFEKLALYGRPLQSDLRRMNLFLGQMELAGHRVRRRRKSVENKVLFNNNNYTNDYVANCSWQTGTAVQAHFQRRFAASAYQIPARRAIGNCLSSNQI